MQRHILALFIVNGFHGCRSDIDCQLCHFSLSAYFSGGHPTDCYLVWLFALKKRIQFRQMFNTALSRRITSRRCFTLPRTPCIKTLGEFSPYTGNKKRSASTLFAPRFYGSTLFVRASQSVGESTRAVIISGIWCI